MNGTIIVAGIGVSIQILLAVFTYGKLSNEVLNHRAWLRVLDEKQANYGTRIARMEGKMGIEIS